MALNEQLRSLFAEIVKEAEENPAFAERLSAVLEATTVPKKAKRSSRRAPGIFDPFDVFVRGEAELRSSLEELDLDQLKDIVAEHGMDRSRLAMKWKTKDRLVDLIVTTVANRSQKGDAFRNA